MLNVVTAPTLTRRDTDWEDEAYSRGYHMALANHADLYIDRPMPGHEEYVKAHREIERIDAWFRPVYEEALPAAKDKLWDRWQSALRPHEFKVMA